MGPEPGSTRWVVGDCPQVRFSPRQSPKSFPDPDVLGDPLGLLAQRDFDGELFSEAELDGARVLRSFGVRSSHHGVCDCRQPTVVRLIEAVANRAVVLHHGRQRRDAAATTERHEALGERVVPDCPGRKCDSHAKHHGGGLDNCRPLG